MSTSADRRLSSTWGLLFQLPLWLVAAFGLHGLLTVIQYSFTDYDVLHKPAFIGIANYTVLFGNDVIRQSLANTVTFVLVVSALLLLTAVLPALLLARLRLPFGLSILAGYTIVSVTSFSPSLFGYLFSDDSYGFLNAQLLDTGIITDPIRWTSPEHAPAIACLLSYLLCLAPVFAITYFGARLGKRAIGTAVAVAAIPLLMAGNGRHQLTVIGFPSEDYAADWLPISIMDYHDVRCEVGFASALIVVGLILLLIWVAFTVGAVWGATALFKRFHPSNTTAKASGYIGFGLCAGWAFLLLFPALFQLQNAFKPLDEFFLFPPRFFTARPTVSNFTSYFTMLESYTRGEWTLWGNLKNLWAILLVYLWNIFPAALGLSLFKVGRRQEWLLLPSAALLLLPLVPSAYQALPLQLTDFLSGPGSFTLLFLSCIALRMMLDPPDYEAGRILLGVFFLITSAAAIGSLTLIWSTNSGYDIAGYSWYGIVSTFAGGGIARAGVAAAADVFMWLFTVGVSVIPLGLLLALYLAYRRALRCAVPGPDSCFRRRSMV